MKDNGPQPSRWENETRGVRDGLDDGQIRWMSGKARSDIAADPEAWLSSVGFVGSIPVVTAESFRRYVENWMMGAGTVIEGDGALIHDSYTERFVFPVVGMVDGAAVYLVEGYGHWDR